MVKKEKVVEIAEKLMHNQKNIRNIGIIAHIDHGKSTMTDSLVAVAGLISEELAGKQLYTDFYELEQQRGVTIFSANISIPYKYEGDQYLINLIDTPGHLDFVGEVIRALRAVDGVILLVDAVEGVMPQTETVLTRALAEHVKPVLLINKVDRLFKELQLTDEQMQERFIKIITEVNKLIKTNQPKGADWTVSIQDGSVSFGSGIQKWAVSIETMKKNNITFKDIAEYLRKEKIRELSKKSPLHEAITEMVIKHLPNPVDAQKYRIPVIWKGDLEGNVGKDLLNCNADGAPVFMVTKVLVDPHAGDIAVGRVYSGTLKQGLKLKFAGISKEVNIQQVGVYIADERIPTEQVPAGNIAYIVGLREALAGDTLSTEDISPFEGFMGEIEPVISISVEAKHPKDLPKLIEVLKQITKEEPQIKTELNQETGEHIVSAIGDFQLEIVEHRIKKDRGLEIITSNPIVVYRETIEKESPEILGKSPNKHNKYLLHLEKLDKKLKEGLKKFHSEGKIKADKDFIERMIEIGFDRDTAKRTWAIYKDNILINNTRGIVQLEENKELIIQGFLVAMKEGPLAKEKASGILVSLNDANLHEDAIHRGPAQTIPAISRAIYAGMLLANAKILEPKQRISLTVPNDFVGGVTKELSSRRAHILEMRTEGDQTFVIAKAPVKEMIGFANSVRSATQGRAVWTAEYAGYEPLPKDLQNKVIEEIRKRKGLDPRPKPAEYYMD